MMSSLVSHGSDTESGTHRPSSNSHTPVSVSSGTYRSFSPSRRLFCLLAAFDFLATLFIWILYAHAFNDEKFKSALKNEVVNYCFKTSLFDIVLLALWRMTVLLLAYALFVSRKWYTVATATAITTGFLLVKVVLMSFQPPSGSEVLYYLLFLSSLLLSWVESWVLDVKVIPNEISVEQHGQLQEERQPLLDDHRGRITPYSLVSDHTFYTPEASDSENEGDRVGDHLAGRRLSQQDREYIQKGKETMEITWELMNLNDGWKSEKVKDGIVVESRVIPSGKKVYRLKDSLDAKAEDVFNLVILHPEDAPKWGGNITFSCVVRKIDHQTDIVYNSTGEAAGGMVASRDFVNLRRWEKRGDVYVSCNVAVKCEEMPPKQEHVRILLSDCKHHYDSESQTAAAKFKRVFSQRGVNGPGGWAIREAEGNPNRTEYVWLFDVDLKGWLPQSVIDAAMSFMLYSTGQGLEAYIRERLG